MNEFVKDLNENVFVDLFPQEGAPKTTPVFGMNSSNDVNILTQETTQAPLSTTGDTTTSAPITTTDQTTQQGTADILGADPEAGKGGRKPKYNFQDASGYFEDRMKTGKLIKVEEELADGTKQLFIPKTPEDFDEVIDIQVNHKLDKARKDLDKEWYQSKSPAWQAVAKYAEMVDDPTQILPFIQGVKTIQSVANLDPDKIDEAEQIVRARLEQRGDPKEAIDTQIESLRATEKLIPSAKQYKPVIIQQEQQVLAHEMQQKQAAETQWVQLITEIRNNTVKTLEEPIFGKERLKNDEKAAIYDLIGEPTSSDGYGIYTAIDQLFDKKDFKALVEVALLLGKKDSFYGYFGRSVANKTVEGLTRKLAAAADGKSTSSGGSDEPEEATVRRGSFTKSPRFGR